MLRFVHLLQPALLTAGINHQFFAAYAAFKVHHPGTGTVPEGLHVFGGDRHDLFSSQ